MRRQIKHRRSHNTDLDLEELEDPVPPVGPNPGAISAISSVELSTSSTLTLEPLLFLLRLQVLPRLLRHPAEGRMPRQRLLRNPPNHPVLLPLQKLWLPVPVRLFLLDW